MKNQIPFFTETQDVFRKINDERNKALRNMFGKFIKPNFMIKIKEEIKTMPEFCEILSQCYNFSIKERI